MLFIFDKDGTLFRLPDPNKNRPANRPEEQVLLPGRLEKIAALRAEGHEIAIATNQGGVAWGFISLHEAANLVQDAAEKIGGADDARFCPHDIRAKGKHGSNAEFAVTCNCRKPSPGMILGIMKRLKYQPLPHWLVQLGFRHPAVIYVGDRAEDEAAARAAGVRFMWAHKFFE